MSEWKTQIQTAEDNELNQIWAEIELSIRSNPSFMELIGITDEEMFGHAMEAVKQHILIYQDQEIKHSLISPESWIQLYIMGFIVGITYGRKHPL